MGLYSQHDPTIPSQRVPYARQELNRFIKEANAHLPLQIDEITVWNKMYINQKTGNITYTYLVDDSSVSMDDLNVSIVKKDLLDDIQNNEDAANLFWDAVVLKKNLVYIYIGYYSKKQKSVTINFNEIRRLRQLAEWL